MNCECEFRRVYAYEKENWIYIYESSALKTKIIKMC